MNDWQQWVDRTTDGSSARAIGRHIGTSHTTVSRWLNTGTASCKDIIRIAKAYGANPVDGLIAGGWLNEDDILTPARVRSIIRHAPAQYLTHELEQRTAAARSQNPHRR